MSQGDSETQWKQFRRAKWADFPPPKDWPAGIRPISREGTSLFGIDPKGRLYWDGEKIVVSRKLELTPWQRWLAGAVAVAAILASFAQFTAWLGFEHAADVWAALKSFAPPTPPWWSRLF